MSGVLLIALALGIALLQYLANYYAWYFHYWYADIPMHFLGGTLIASFTLWWLRFEVPIGLRDRIPRFTVTLGVVVAVGVAWEIFEYFTGMHAASNYPLDTVLDFATNTAGFLFAYLVFTKYAR